VRKTTALFWDVGGVILTNGWDREARRAAEERFGLDSADFEQRHELANPDFELGKATLDQYLEQTVFYRERPFSPREFKEFIYSQSSALPESLAFAGRLAGARRYLMAALNNEGAEVNAYRIEHFGLRRLFTLFLSSCYVGARKPDAAIYDLALKVTQRSPQECVFVDDREPNIAGARKIGMDTILFQGAAQLEGELYKRGIEIPAA
jgi:putative hydrolase of the HAD superfamily